MSSAEHGKHRTIVAKSHHLWHRLARFLRYLLAMLRYLLKLLNSVSAVVRAWEKLGGFDLNPATPY
jgi:hypothetical protein